MIASTGNVIIDVLLLILVVVVIVYLIRLFIGR